MAANTNDIIEHLIEKLCSIGSPDALEHASHLAECLLQTQTQMQTQSQHNSNTVVTNAYKNMIESFIAQGNAIIDNAIASRNIVK